MLEEKMTARRKKILLYLLRNGSVAGYTLWKRTDLPRSSAYEGLKDLLHEEMIEVKIDPEWDGFLEKKVCSLTILGLCYSLLLTLDEWPSVICRWSYLAPLVLGKWDLFINSGIEFLVQAKLTLATVELINEYERKKERKAIQKMLGSEMSEGLFSSTFNASTSLAESFTHKFYNPTPIASNSRALEDHEKWLEACSKDPEISEYFKKKIKKLKMLNKIQYEMIQKLENRFIVNA